MRRSPGRAEWLHDIDELAPIALRALAVWGLVLVVIRLAGKRTIGNFTAFDLLVALMVGEVVDEIIYGDVTFAQGVTAIATVGFAQYANSWISYWGHGLDRVLEGAPTVLVDREHWHRVASARLERDGRLSVLLTPAAQPVRRAVLGTRG